MHDEQSNGPAEETNQSNLSSDSPQLPSETESKGSNPQQPTFGRLALGSALLLGDTVGARLSDAQPTAESQTPTRESVLRPVGEWESSGNAFEQGRFVVIGATKDIRGRVGQSGRTLFEAADAAGRIFEKTTRNFRRSRPLRPVRLRFLRYQQRGEGVISRWGALGQREEMQSRAIAEATLGSLVQQSVSDLSESPHVQVLVQQVVASQGTGILSEVVEEIRERIVTLDILLENHTTRLTRLPTRGELPPPPFRPDYIRNRPTLFQISQVELTMAGQYAGFISRLIGFFIDLIILILSLSLTTTFISAFIDLFNLQPFFSQVFNNDDAIRIVTGGLAALAGISFVVVYGVLFWSLSGQTLGDFLVGVRVIRSNGSRVSFGRSVLRIIGAYISGIVVFLGFLWALWDPRHQGWHDKLAGTVVVYDWPAVPDELFLRDQLRVVGVLPRQQRLTSHDPT
ncbi:MAG: RDD family protein [Chloroflexota bacterium]